MNKPSPPRIDYAPRPPRRGNGVLARVIAGVLAGGITSAGAHLLNGLSLLIIGGVCGVIVGFVSAQAAQKRLFLAGIVGNLIAAAVVIAVPLALEVLHGISLSLSLEFLWLQVITPAVFLIPGLIGSLWVWEGRRPMPESLD